ncbi:MAG: hypothetical protein EOL87_16545 [Spartobacteria bacterium]|nr:hypothetical protein [Spartobacteria bacterium]
MTFYCKDRCTHFVSLLLLLCAMQTVLQAQWLEPDYSFKTDLKKDDPVRFEYVDCIAVQRDGKILVGGFWDLVNGAVQENIARLNQDGSRDTSFIAGTGADAQVNCMLIESNGQILIGGYFSNYNGVMRQKVARLNADGSLDLTFTSAIISGEVFDMQCLSDGDLLVGGEFSYGVGGESSSIARLNANGTLDSTFAASTSGRIWDFESLTNGKILICGAFMTVNGTPRQNFARLNVNGSIDTSFQWNQTTFFNDLAVQADGKIILSAPSSGNPTIMRVQADGTVDSSFQPPVLDAGARSISVLPNGKILIGGDFTTVNGESRIRLARLNGDGSLDEAFDPQPGFDDTVRAITVDASGNVLAGGFFDTFNGFGTLCAARFYNPSSRGGASDNMNAVFDTASRPIQRIGLPDYRINTASLNLLLEGTLFRMKTLGPSIAATLYYNAAPPFTDPGFGLGWSFEYNAFIKTDDRFARLTKGSGRPYFFSSTTELDTASAQNPITLTSPEGMRSTLTAYGDYFLLLDRTTRETFRYQKQNDGLFRLTSIADRNGNTVDITRNATNGKITKITDEATRELVFQYNAAGRCESIRVPDGRSIQFQYDTSGHLTGITDMAGYKAAYGYDAEHYLASLNLAGRTALFTYQDKTWEPGRYVTQIDNANKDIVTYAFDGNTPGVMQRTSADGRMKTYTSNQGFTTKVSDPLDGVLSAEYANNLPVKASDSQRKLIGFTYDSNGNLTRQSDAFGAATTMTYDQRNNLTLKHQPDGGNWLYSYDSKDNLTCITDPLGYKLTFTYDSQGRLLTATDAKTNVVRYTHDNYGNLRSITQPNGSTISYLYSGNDAYQRCVGVTDAAGSRKSYTYDAYDRPLTILQAIDNAQKVITYNAFDPLTVKNERSKTTRATWDTFSCLTQLTDPLNHTTRFAYDTDHHLTNTVDALGHSRSIQYDEAGRPVRETEADHTYIERAYDSDGNLITLYNYNRQPTRYTYDWNNQLFDVTDPLGNNVERYVYDSMGRVSYQHNARGQQCLYTYDLAGNQTTQRIANTPEIAAYAYDSVGNLTNVTDRTGTLSYRYDAMKRVTNIVYPGGLSMGFTYDSRGNVSRMDYPGFSVTYQYDTYCRAPAPAGFNAERVDAVYSLAEPSHRVTRMAWDSASVTYQYNTCSRLLQENNANGATSCYTYDDAGRLKHIAHAKGTQNLYDLECVSDAAGNIVYESSSPSPTPAQQQSIASASYDLASQLSAWNGAGCTTDLDGNLTAAGTLIQSAKYDAYNRPTNLICGGISYTYSYNGKNQRVRAKVGSVTRNYHYDQQGRLLFETDAAGQWTVAYLYKGTRLVAQRTSAGATRFYHFDTRGHTRLLTDTSGTVLTRYDYLPFGQIAASGQTSLYNPFKYVGAFGVMDEGNHLFFMNNRYYHALLGRFIQRDPSGFSGGYNLYRYANNNPATAIDPLGLAPLDPYDDYKWNYENSSADTQEGMPEPEQSDESKAARDRDRSSEELAMYLLDKTISLSPVGKAYGIAKTAGKLAEGDLGGAAWEGFKTALGPVGDAIGLEEDVIRDRNKQYGGKSQPYRERSVEQMRADEERAKWAHLENNF